MDKDVLRRIAERGLEKAQAGAELPNYPEYENWDDRRERLINQAYLDLFQHILDELERIE